MKEESEMDTSEDQGERERDEDSKRIGSERRKMMMMMIQEKRRMRRRKRR